MGKKEDESKWIYVDNKGKEVEPKDLKGGKVYKLAVRKEGKDD